MQILQLLINAIPHLPFYLKILVTSRPEPHIQSVLVPSSNLHITALHDIEASIVTGDILVYLRAQLLNLQVERNSTLKPGWITDDQINLLAEKAGNLFILAVTSLRFLSESLDPRRQLDILLDVLKSTHGVSPGSNPFLYLDNLYLEILRGMISPTNAKEVVESHQAVVGSIVVLRDSLPVEALEQLLGPTSPRASTILPFLHSVILPPTSPTDCPRIYHPSFPDFLQDRNRCTEERFWIDNKKHEARMALRCLELINTALHKGMLGELANCEVDGIEDKVKAAFPLELQYTCRYWAAHFLAAMEGEMDAAIVECFNIFVAKSLVPWVEAMSWLGEARLCLASLEDINSWATKRSSSPLTKSVLNDAHRMLLAHFPTIKLGATHISRSVFPFLPRNIPLVSQYPDYIDPSITTYSTEQFSDLLGGAGAGI